MTHRKTLASLLSSSLIVVALISVSYAQKSGEKPISSRVELVQVPVTIFDDKGRVATGLKKSDFRLFDDGVEQDILYFEQERVPVSFVVLADMSSSMTRKIPFVKEAALSLVNTPAAQARSCDEYSVLSIGTRSRLLMPFTCDQEYLERQLPLLLTPTDKESTALFDTMWMGVNTAERGATNTKRAMIIITDGGDNHSRYNIRETARMLQEADLPVFAVMPGPSFELPRLLAPEQGKTSPLPTGRLPRLPVPNVGLPKLSISTTTDDQDYIGPAERRGPKNMRVLTEASGGAVFTAKHASDLPRIVRTIGLAIRYRYVITYKPARTRSTSQEQGSKASDPYLHKVHVELYPKQKFNGYSVPYYKGTYHSIQ